MARLIDRLHNWGAWARSDDGGPADSCVASFWSKWLPHKAWDAGWGDAPTEEPHTPDIDDIDAERIDCWVRQLPRGPRALLITRYVLRRKVDRLEHDAAVRALADLMGENVATVRAIRVLIRGAI